MNHDSAKEFCDKWLSAWTGGKAAVKRLLSFYNENAFYLDSMLPMGLTGHEDIKIYFERLLSRYPDWSYRAVEIIPTEKGFVLKWELAIPVGKDKITTMGLDIVEVVENLITRNEVYFDRTALMK